MKRKINYQSSDGMWYDIICHDYYVEDCSDEAAENEKQEGQKPKDKNKDYCPLCHAELASTEYYSGGCCSCGTTFHA